MRHGMQHPASQTSRPPPSGSSLERAQSSARGALALLAVVALLPACATFAEYDSDQDFGIGIRGHLPLTRVLSPEGSVGEATASRLELGGSLHRFTPGPNELVIGSADLVLPRVAGGDGAARLYTGAGAHSSLSAMGGLRLFTGGN